MLEVDPPNPFLLCIKKEGYPAALELREVYRAIPDAKAASRGFARVVDESGEDYLYPLECFVPVELPPAAAQAFAALS